MIYINNEAVIYNNSFILSQETKTHKLFSKMDRLIVFLKFFRIVVDQRFGNGLKEWKIV